MSDHFSFSNASEFEKQIFPGRDAVTKKSFAEFFDRKLKQLSETSLERISKKDIAAAVDISSELFRKIVNKALPTRKRECIIAICAVLRLNKNDTNLALYYYDNMPELNELDERDKVITDFLNENSLSPDKIFDPDIISRFNDWLINNDQDKLDIINHRNAKKQEKKEYPYKVIRKEVINFREEINEFGSYLPLANRYLNLNYAVATMELEDNGMPVFLYFSSDTDVLSRTSGKGDFSDEIIYRNIDETGKFRSCFIELKKMVYSEVQKTDKIYNDTRNFGSRINSRVKDGDLHLFTEHFNMNIPALNEYYLMDYCNGIFTFTVSRKSRFMMYRLSEEEYTKRYGKEKPEVTDTYHSYEELKDMAEFFARYENPAEYFSFEKTVPDNYSISENCRIIKDSALSYGWRMHYYKIMKEELEILIEDLKNGKERISNLNFRNNPYEVLSKYDNTVGKAFHCVYETDKEALEIAESIEDQVRNAPDTDQSFDFEEAFKKLKTIQTAPNGDIYECVSYSDYRKLKYKYFKQKIRQGARLEDLDNIYRSFYKEQYIITEIEKDEAVFRLSDGRDVKLTLQDLIDGAHLNVFSVEELGKLKLKHGTCDLNRLLGTLSPAKC